MAHVTFIHGLGNKPPADALLATWKRALAAGGGIDLDAAGVTHEMVYWADVLYERPEDPAEGDDDGPRAGAGAADRAGEPDWTGALPEAERRFVERLSAGIERSSAKVRERLPAPAAADRAIPLPGFLERWLMKRLVRDAHHYLYDSTFSPRPGTEFRVRAEIRRRFVDAVARGAARPGPHVVVSHSLGTVIAYDCLARVGDTPRVDGLVTVGSPLGLSEVQDGFGGAWSSREGYPAGRVPRDAWANVYDPLDVVCGVDPRLADDYELAGDEVVRDFKVRNHGTWRHAIREYLQREALREGLRAMLRT